MGLPNTAGRQAGLSIYVYLSADWLTDCATLVPSKVQPASLSGKIEVFTDYNSFHCVLIMWNERARFSKQL